jgi:hypothetical protein
MAPVCPSCGSVAVVRNGKSAACMNPRCRDNGSIKPVQVFRQELAHVLPDPRKLSLGSGCTRTLPLYDLAG